MSGAREEAERTVQTVWQKSRKETLLDWRKMGVVRGEGVDLGFFFKWY